MDNRETEPLIEHRDDRDDQKKALLTASANVAVVIPVIDEELDISRRVFTTGTVRIQKVVHEREELVEEPTIHSKVEIERISINRIVEAPPPVRQDGETTIYSVVEEVIVVTKQLVLKEEVRITNRISELPHRQSITLRTEELVVDRGGN